MRLRIDTRGLAPEEQFAFWRNELGNRLMRLDIVRAGVDVNDDDPFFGRVLSSVLGDLVFSQYDCDGTTQIRRQQHINEDGKSAYILTMSYGAPIRLTQNGYEVVVQAGEPGVIDIGQPSTATVEERNRHITVMLPSNRLGPLLKEPEFRRPQRIDVTSGAGLLLAQLLRAMPQALQPGVAEQQGQPLGEQLLQFTSMAINVSSQGFEAATPALQQLRYDQICAAIKAQAQDPDISPAGVAAQMGISEPYLYRVLNRYDARFSEIVRGYRLAKAADLLSDLEHASDGITEIALQCGFKNHSYFSRAFKHFFGMSPREWRQKSHQRVRHGST